MSHIFLFGGVKIGSNTAFHCFVLWRKLIYSIKYVVYDIKRQVFIGESTILNKKNICCLTVTVLEKLSSSYRKEFQMIAYRQRTGKNLFPNAKGFKL